MRCAIAGEPAYHLGEIVDLREDIARAWIADGLADPIEDEVETAVSGRPVVTRTRKRR